MIRPLALESRRSEGWRAVFALTAAPVRCDPAPSFRPRFVGRPARMTAGTAAAIALLVTRRRARSFDRQYLAAVRRRDPLL
jgi:hypothetical protein